MSHPEEPFDRLRDPTAAGATALGRGSAQGEEGAEFADICQQLMVTVPRRLDGRPLPRVVAITASPESIGLLLSEPRDDPASGFRVIDGGLTWTVEPSTISRETGGCGVPWPLLVSFGEAGSGGPAVMANLEELRVLQLSGEPGDVLAFAESLAAELAVDRFGARPRVVCVNFAWELESLDVVSVARSSSQALAEAELQGRRIGARAERTSLPEFRRHGLRDIPRPLVIIDPHGRDPQIRSRLARLAGPGLAVVTASRRQDPRRESPPGQKLDPGWGLHVAGRRLRWEPVGVNLWLADIPGPEISSDRPSVPVTRELPGAGMPAANGDTSPGEVELQVLGVVRAVGVASPFTSQRALDLACYLALHRDGATADKLRHWLWGRAEPPPSAKTFANVVSRARVCLGWDDDGEPHLSHLGADGVYRLSPEVTTDLERFTAWRRLAERVPPAQAVECLRAALELVRGAPFGGGSGDTFSWADASWRSHVEYLVDCTAHRLADLALESGRPKLARWAALRGLALAPDCEQCFERRIAAARRSGHHVEVDRVMHHMDRLLREPLPELEELLPGAVDAMPSPTA
ncbi:MAG: hypothetical protein OXI26_01890 [bacterium]|nr:hypothetical protein [bacterium]